MKKNLLSVLIGLSISISASADNLIIRSSVDWDDVKTDKFYKPHLVGSAGFFKEQGDDEALKIIVGAEEKSKYYTYDSKGKLRSENGYVEAKIRLGEEGDVTNLQNMKKSLEIIKETNKLRKQNGLNELKVSNRLMAVAQVQTSWSGNQEDDHSRMNLNAGENLAWANGINKDDPDYVKGNSAFEGWYEAEKDKFESQNDTKNYHKCTNETGHYCNIIYC